MGSINFEHIQVNAPGAARGHLEFDGMASGTHFAQIHDLRIPFEILPCAGVIGCECALGNIIQENLDHITGHVIKYDMIKSKDTTRPVLLKPMNN